MILIDGRIVGGHVVLAELSELVEQIDGTTELRLNHDIIRPLRLPKKESDVADAKSVYQLFGQDGRPLAVLILSPEAFPETMEMVAKNVDTICAGLPIALMRPIVRPILRGWDKGRSYAVFPYASPVSDNRLLRKLQTLQLRRTVPDWLTEIARHSVRDVIAPEQRFHEPITTMIGDKSFSGIVRRGAEESLAALEAGYGHPRTVLQHGDFWIGNILLSGASPLRRDFLVIDWDTANWAGYPLVDLIRFSLSVTRNRRWQQMTLKRYMANLGLDRTEVMYHLNASIGWMGMQRRQFPKDLYLRVSERMLEAARTALN